MLILKNRLLTFLTVCLLVVGAASLSACAPQNETPQSPTVQSPVQVEVVFNIDLRQGVALGVVDLPVPASGYFFSNTAKYDEGTTLLDVIKLLDAEYTFNAVITGEGQMAYLESLYGIVAGLAGPNSGWTYTVNGEMAMEGIGALVLQDGDVVELSYIVFEF